MTRETRARAQDEAKVWSGSPYYDDAERWMYVFWGRHSSFVPFFNQLDLTRVLELACGHGRHSEHVAKYCFPEVGEMTCMDILPENIEFTQKRLARWSKLKPIRIIQNSGIDHRPVEDGAITGLFCYDAMVHFHADVIANYLNDAARVLTPGGMALYHHSNYSAAPGSSFGLNPRARAHMSADLFAQLVRQAGLQVVEQKVISWGGIDELDCISLVKRP